MSIVSESIIINRVNTATDRMLSARVSNANNISLEFKRKCVLNICIPENGTIFKCLVKIVYLTGFDRCDVNGVHNTNDVLAVETAI